MGMREAYTYAIQTAKGTFQGHAAARSSDKTYTVKTGDTLGGIAQAHLGNAGAYMKVFDLNKDQLTDPDKIKPGQVLHLP
jgi:nucleoid-associated protein YgaU